MGSVVIVLCFVAGLLCGGVVGEAPGFMSDLSLWLLFLLMFQVGIGVGADDNLPTLLRRPAPRLILLPAATVVGTLAATAVVVPLLQSVSFGQALAINSACGYYSLSSILVLQLTVGDVGVTIAAELGAIALIANVLRELIALVFGKWIARRFGAEAEIAVAGVTSVDVCLATIRRYCGEQWVAAAVIHGTLIDLATPWLIALFCSIG